MVKETKAETCQSILENMHTTVLLFDEQLRLRYINPAGEMLFAMSAKRIVGVPAAELLRSDELLQALGDALETGHPFTKRELSVGLLGETESTVDVTALPLSDARRRRELLVEMNSVDRQIRINREESLLSQTQTTRVLVRGLAHEIKNPLGGLRGAAQLLERELESEELKEFTRIIISEADRLRNLVNRMLGPRALPQFQTINIHEIVERVRQLVQAEIPPGVSLLRDYDPSIPELHADPDQLIQALLNLLRNAVQAVGASGEIILRTRTLRQYTIGHQRYKLVARIEVIDSGPGVLDEVKEGIFLPMVTGRADGTGLGLPIAQSLINMHHGLIECESRPGRTTFTILLPLLDELGETGTEMETTPTGVADEAGGVKR